MHFIRIRGGCGRIVILHRPPFPCIATGQPTRFRKRPKPQQENFRRFAPHLNIFTQKVAPSFRDVRHTRISAPGHYLRPLTPLFSQPLFSFLPSPPSQSPQPPIFQGATVKDKSSGSFTDYAHPFTAAYFKPAIRASIPGGREGSMKEFSTESFTVAH